MRVCGVDPGLEITGYGVIDVAGNQLTLVTTGVFRTSASDLLTTRLKEMYDQVLGLLASTTPDLMVLEELYSQYKHPTTAIMMGHVRGVIVLAAAARGVPLQQYGPTHVKKAVTGHGHARKEQTQRMVQALLGLAKPPEPDDATDALAIAIAHAHTLRAPFAGVREMTFSRLGAARRRVTSPISAVGR